MATKVQLGAFDCTCHVNSWDCRYDMIQISNAKASTDIVEVYLKVFTVFVKYQQYLFIVWLGPKQKRRLGDYANVIKTDF